MTAGADEGRGFEPLRGVVICESRRISLGLEFFCRGTCPRWIGLWRAFGEPPEKVRVGAYLTESQDQVDSKTDENQAICDYEDFERVRRAVVEEKDVQHDG